MSNDLLPTESPLTPTESNRLPTESHRLPQSPIDSHRTPPTPTKSHSHHTKLHPPPPSSNRAKRTTNSKIYLTMPQNDLVSYPLTQILFTSIHPMIPYHPNGPNVPKNDQWPKNTPNDPKYQNIHRTWPKMTCVISNRKYWSLTSLSYVPRRDSHVSLG